MNTGDKKMYVPAVLAAACGVYLLSVGIPCMVTLLEEPQEIRLNVPPRADVQSSRDVQPGTFTVTIPLEEFIQRAWTSDQRALVTYGRPVGLVPAGSDHVVVRYWLPRTDVVGTFYYTENHVPAMRSLASDIGTIHRNGNTLIVNPERNARGGALRILGGLGLLIGAFACFLAARGPTNATQRQTP